MSEYMQRVVEGLPDKVKAGILTGQEAMLVLEYAMEIVIDRYFDSLED